MQHHYRKQRRNGLYQWQKKSFQNAIPACDLLRKNCWNGVLACLRHKNTPCYTTFISNNPAALQWSELHKWLYCREWELCVHTSGREDHNKASRSRIHVSPYFWKRGPCIIFQGTGDVILHFIKIRVICLLWINKTKFKTLFKNMNPKIFQELKIQIHKVWYYNMAVLKS